MTTLFDIELYHQPEIQGYKSDWDGAFYDPAWDEPDGLPKILQNEVVADEEVLEERKEEVGSNEISSDWNSAHFGEVPRKFDEAGNPMIFWDESIELPLPDDFNSSQEYEQVWLLESPRLLGSDYSTSTDSLNEGKKKTSDCWCVPLQIVELIVRVLEQINLELLTGSTRLEKQSSSVLPVERTSSTRLEKQSPSVLPVGRTSSTQLEEQSPSVLPVEQTSSTTRRSYGEGTGRIHWRTITKKNGKQYQQPWYDWQLKSGEKTISKSSYITKKLLSQVQMLEAQKAPVREILQLLGINL
ncbi:MAG: hypothetical protein HC836_39700 [Richelia sp. RM2_1_2]|nr:hypothetical protein [Richelia sp. RM2_1_2]